MQRYCRLLEMLSRLGWVLSVPYWPISSLHVLWLAGSVGWWSRATIGRASCKFRPEGGGHNLHGLARARCDPDAAPPRTSPPRASLTRVGSRAGERPGQKRRKQSVTRTELAKFCLPDRYARRPHKRCLQRFAREHVQRTSLTGILVMYTAMQVWPRLSRESVRVAEGIFRARQSVFHLWYTPFRGQCASTHVS